MLEVTVYGMLIIVFASCLLNWLFCPRPSDLCKLASFNQKTLTELSDIPHTMRSPESLIVTQLVYLLEFKMLIEPTEGNCFSVNLTC